MYDRSSRGPGHEALAVTGRRGGQQMPTTKNIENQIELSIRIYKTDESQEMIFHNSRQYDPYDMVPLIWFT